MSPISVRVRHVNGQMEPVTPLVIPPGSDLVLTVFPPEGAAESKSWGALAAGGLTRAYGPDEPDYSEADLRP
jgi:hypothetical protein